VAFQLHPVLRHQRLTFSRVRSQLHGMRMFNVELGRGGDSNTSDASACLQMLYVRVLFRNTPRSTPISRLLNIEESSNEYSSIIQSLLAPASGQGSEDNLLLPEGLCSALPVCVCDHFTIICLHLSLLQYIVRSVFSFCFLVSDRFLSYMLTGSGQSFAPVFVQNSASSSPSHSRDKLFAATGGSSGGVEFTGSVVSAAAMAAASAVTAAQNQQQLKIESSPLVTHQTAEAVRNGDDSGGIVCSSTGRYAGGTTSVACADSTTDIIDRVIANATSTTSAAPATTGRRRTSK